jgi:hypothetical protein
MCYSSSQWEQGLAAPTNKKQGKFPKYMPITIIKRHGISIKRRKDIHVNIFLDGGTYEKLAAAFM